MLTIPTPAEAQELRALFAGNPAVARAEHAIRAFGINPDARRAARLLPMWAHYSALTERERRAVLARFVPPPAERPPLVAVPDCGPGDEDGNSGPGWPLGGAR